MKYQWLNSKIIYFTSSLVLGFFSIIRPVLGHEVYVLDQETIDQALINPPLQVFSIIVADIPQFFFWAFLTLLVLSFVGVVSVSKRFEALCDPTLLRIKKYAPLIGRVTLGISILASGYFGALFGPELPLTMYLPEHLVLATRIFLMLTGSLLIVGCWTRSVSIILILIFLAMTAKFSFYMLTYVNYFGEMIISFALGGKIYAVDKYLTSFSWGRLRGIIYFIEDHAFFLLRLGFGISLLFASFYAKLFHAQLAIETVIKYNLTDYLPFSPEFIVLGAFAVEILLGLLFILGLEVRFAALFLIVFLIMSLFYFGEAVWPHFILAGGALTIFAEGYGKYTLERRYLSRHNRGGEEPVF
jgi:uncharacterized membrane protein YphA (DoxX/SURF4 family)